MILYQWAGVILYLLMFFPLLLVFIDSSYRLLFLVVAHLSSKKKIEDCDQNTPLRLLILIVARNEQGIIEQTLSKLKTQTDGDDRTRIAVLADHCSDQTADIATKLGAQVYLRENGKPGKAEALSWFAYKRKGLLSDADVIAVLDADTLVDEKFCQAIRAAFRPGVEVVQGYVQPVSKDGFPLTTLVSFSEILSQEIDDMARSRLHWSVPLRGTGMAFRTQDFCRVCRGLGTQVDDIELSVRLAEQNISVYFCPKAKILDPKADDVVGLAKQRGRWLKGQRQIWTTKHLSILKLLRARSSNWSLIHAMLLKPKTALLIIKIFLLIVLLLWPFLGTLGQVLVAVVCVSVLIDFAYYLVGLRYTSAPYKYLVSFLGTPLFIILWIISWGFSLWPTREWLRGREN